MANSDLSCLIVPRFFSLKPDENMFNFFVLQEKFRFDLFDPKTRKGWGGVGHSEAACGLPFRKEKNSKKPKICGKRHKRTPFLRLRELKWFWIDWKSNSTPFWPFRVIGSSTRSWDNILFRRCNIKNKKCDIISRQCWTELCTSLKNPSLTKGFNYVLFGCLIKFYNHLNPTKLCQSSTWPNGLLHCWGWLRVLWHRNLILPSLAELGWWTSLIYFFYFF